MLTFLAYLRYIRLVPLPFLFLMGVCLANGVIFLITAFLGKLIYDRLLTSLDGWLLVKLVLLSILLMAGAAANTALYEFARAMMRERLVHAMRIRFLKDAMRYRYSFFLETETGRLVKGCLGELSLVAEGVTSLAVFFGLALQVSLGLTAFLFTRSWIFWIYLSVIAGYSFWFSLWKWPISRTAHKLDDSYTGLFVLFGELFHGMKEVRLFGGLGYMLERFGSLQGAVRRHLILNTLSHAGFWTAAALPWIAYPLVLWLAIGDIGRGELTVGIFVAMLSFLWGLLDPLVQSIEHMGNVHNGILASNRLESIPGRIPESRPAGRLREFSHEIEFRNVTFNHARSSKPILDGIDLKIPKGRNVALIGESGSGKTTLANLLLRLHEGYSGSIRIDGKELNSLSPDSIRDRICLLSQEICLFRDTLRTNIDPWGRLSDPEILDVCGQAGLESLVAAPDGLDSQVDEMGANFSGGERQRIALARCLARKAEIMVFDEPTSALDPQTEKAVWNSILAASKGRTTITVTHKLALLESMDWIFVLDAGRIVQEGTYRQIQGVGN
jgi:subfamily B ATP-binding cassette protein MsbA